jgi:NCS1 family nucleobase:cation symporter-1
MLLLTAVAAMGAMARIYLGERRHGPGGWLLPAIFWTALAAGILPCIPGFAAAAGLVRVAAFWSRLYDYAWFVSFGMALVSYVLLMKAFGTVTGDASGDE